MSDGEITNFTGIDSDYQAPLQAEIDLPAGELPLGALVDLCIAELKQRHIIA